MPIRPANQERMNYILGLHPLILQDFNEAYIWYEDQRRGFRGRFSNSVRGKIEQILIHPPVYGGRCNNTFGEAKVEFFPYPIVYKIYEGKKEVFISSIHSIGNIRRKNIEKGMFNDVNKQSKLKRFKSCRDGVSEFCLLMD
jgi:hypothetical protein